MTSHDSRHDVYLIPGLFGFGQLAGYDYFAHLARAIEERFAEAGARLALHVVPAPPTASITVSAAVVAKTIARTAGERGPIHLVGHSTGGLAARLLVAPEITLPLAPHELDWTRRVRSLLAINTPHYGTPLAAYFTTAAGTRLLYALSLLTVTTLSIGRLPLTLLSALLAAIEGAERSLRIEIRLLDELSAQVLRFVDERGRAEIRDYLEHVHSDQAGIVQLMPEVMELFNSAVVDSADVRYGCVATAAPAPSARRLLSALHSPVGALQLAMYTTVYEVTSRSSARYPYATPTAAQAVRLTERIGPVNPQSVDGIVPTRSMLWGDLVWCGMADHLDIVGHFADDCSPPLHVDWLGSGARFRRRDFSAMTDALCGFMLER